MLADICGNRTKHDLDKALRALLETKSLDQIRVRELTDLCGIRRQSFYYHFPDVYQLFDWSLQQEQAWLLERQTLFLTWQQAVEDLLAHMARQRSYYLALLETRGRAAFQEALGGVLTPLLRTAEDYYRRRSGGRAEGAAAVDCRRAMLLALMESWLQGDLRQQPGEVVSMLENGLRQGSLAAAWENLPQMEPAL